MNLKLIMLQNSRESFDQFREKKKCLLIDITKLSQLGTHQGKEIHTRSFENGKLEVPLTQNLAKLNLTNV